MTERSRGADLARRFTEVQRRALSLLESCSPEGWSRIAVDDRRAVGWVAEHIAVTHERALVLVPLRAAGEPLPAWAGDRSLSEREYARAEAAPAPPDQAEVLARLRTAGDELAAFIGGLDDAALLREGMSGRTLEQGIELVVIEHLTAHLTSFERTLANP